MKWKWKLGGVTNNIQHEWYVLVTCLYVEYPYVIYIHNTAWPDEEKHTRCSEDKHKIWSGQQPKATA